MGSPLCHVLAVTHPECTTPYLEDLVPRCSHSPLPKPILSLPRRWATGLLKE